MKSILDPTFHYIPAAQTDLRKTFSRVRRDMAKAKALEAVRHGAKVTPLTQRKGSKA